MVRFVNPVRALFIYPSKTFIEALHLSLLKVIAKSLLV